ncbi:hypothetical protein [Halorientalis pallida]|uniref:PH domain-containing protein n=1 Tax=Halorientalis pallida TaxID=2479928 RepID=A0A498L6B9_9EURY|nr:hypothetical protein [Halorientalis pallida]RXK51832.1 hypothetical protein EAF64_04145 [Halorientalis pallida]
MTDSDVAERAFVLAEMSSDDSVTMAVLAGRESRFSASEPLNDPPVTYLEETEAPVFVLTNGKRGVGRGVKSNTVAPEGSFRTVVLVTGRRTLCLVGRTDGDAVITIPHESVAAVRYSTGFRKHRLVLQTPESAYHCWVHRKTGERLLESVTEFLRERKVERPEPVEDDEAVSRVMYRGRPVARDATDESGDTSSGSAESTDGETEEEFTVTYRGRPVDRD